MLILGLGKVSDSAPQGLKIEKSQNNGRQWAMRFKRLGSKIYGYQNYFVFDLTFI